MRAGADAAAEQTEPFEESEVEGQSVEGSVRPRGGERTESWVRQMERVDWERERRTYVCGVDAEVEEVEGEDTQGEDLWSKRNHVLVSQQFLPEEYRPPEGTARGGDCCV